MWYWPVGREAAPKPFNISPNGVLVRLRPSESEGFAFVVMAQEEGADKAIELNGSQLNGRSVTVNEAKATVKRGFGGGGSRAGETFADAATATNLR